METFELWPGGPVMENSRDAEPVGTDSVLLASFPRLAGVTRAADFGSGSGLLALILANRRQDLTVDCVELDHAAAELCRRNIRRNGLDARLHVLEGDLRKLRQADVGRYQLIISNPPYRPQGSGSPPAEGRRAAREERTCALSELAQAAARLLGDGGRFDVVYPASRLAEAMAAFCENGLEPKRLRRGGTAGRGAVAFPDGVRALRKARSAGGTNAYTQRAGRHGHPGGPVNIPS